MARLHLKYFAGMLPEMDARLIPKNNAQIAHNCELEDGVLRAMPAWVLQQRAIDRGGGGILWDGKIQNEIITYVSKPIALNGAPFASGILVGIVEDYSSMYVATEKEGSVHDAAIEGEVFDWSISYARSYNSNKPVNRIYGYTLVRKRYGTTDEGTLTVIPGQSPKDVLYEGDLVTIYGVNNSTATHVRLYRTITGMDTGEVITNELDTEWHLVAEIEVDRSLRSFFTYIDGDSATALPLDVYYAGRFAPLAIKPRFFGLTEEGYFVAADEEGNIALSERYKYHAWPEENYFSINEPIVALEVVGNNVYVGTEGQPYVMAVSTGEAGAQGALVRYEEHLPCMKGSMAKAEGGVIYASHEGLVSLSRDGARVITADTLRTNTVLLRYVLEDNYGWPPRQIPMAVNMRSTRFAAYHAGKYYGFPGTETRRPES